jgi:hypothetical protein
MAPVWEKIRAILSGLDAVREHRTDYLPRFEGETNDEYNRRLNTTSWRPEFEDGLRNLSAKPFQKDISLADGAPEQIKTFAEDVDGGGTNLTRFSKEYFDTGVGFGLGAILVDYPTMQAGITLADEKQSGARPYWCLIQPENIIALYFKNVGGRSVISHFRFRECYTEQDGFEEVEIDRVRVFEIAPDGAKDRNGQDVSGKVRWQVWESTPVNTSQQASGDKKKQAYSLIDEGLISLPEIPVSLFFTGKRSGNFIVHPPLLSLADAQIELYQKLSNKNEIQAFAGSPMLKLLGVSNDSLPTEDDGSGKKVPTVTVSPKRVITLPPGVDGAQPDADYIQPAAANMTELREDINDLIEYMRRLAMQPITDKSGNPTATGQAIDQAKAHSTLQSWALGLKDALELALKYTAQWMNLNVEPEVQVFTDFGVDATGVEEAAVLQKDAQSGQISRRTYWAELQRRDILSAEFDADSEEELISQQGGALGDMVDPLAGPNAGGGQQQQEAA